MKKIIATTTINAPTEAIRKYDAMEDWELLVVGDLKTPEYKLERGYFMGRDEQMDRYKDLCELIGWNSVARGRMIAWIEAYKRTADILASIDDDCMPTEEWGNAIYVGAIVPVCLYETEDIAFDPIGRSNKAWHRGYPLELACRDERPKCVYENGSVEALVQEDFCYEQSDFDATLRIAKAEIEQDISQFRIASHCFSPINTQNTFIHRSVIKDFPANIPFIGRADDIWAGYIFQALHPNSTIYCAPTAIHQQDRSIQSIVDDLEREIFMYRNTYGFLKTIKDKDLAWAMNSYLPLKSREAIDLYRSYFDD